MKIRISSLLSPFYVHSDSPRGVAKIPKRASRDPDEVERRLDEIFNGQSEIRLFLEDTGVPVKTVVYGADSRGYEKSHVEGGVGAAVHVWKLRDQTD
ncbi:hypothetical protein [Brevibacterium zhoupengii]|uniref:hypothetical protein n=1 Tax=Brevibacterium zhoupengii TaxID=2898795 RepID=UPI001E2EB88F|nr:hypothetical protein [Brevibacterium zhoupengii]